MGKGKHVAVDPEVAANEAAVASWRLRAEALSKKMQKETTDFNEFQQQREKLNYFWIVEKKRLEDKRSELRNKDRELQDLEEKHQVEIKTYKQRLSNTKLGNFVFDPVLSIFILLILLELGSFFSNNDLIW
jgi:chromosome segregation ATPase